MRLRTLLAWTTGALVLPTLIAVAALMVVTTQLRDSATQVADSLNSIRTAKRIEVSLLLYEHVSNLSASARAIEHAPTRAKVMENLRTELARARQFVSSPLEARVLSETHREVERYLASVRRFEAEGLPSLEVMERARPQLDLAFARTQDLVLVNAEYAQATMARVERWDRLAVAGAGAIGVALCIGVLGGLTLVHRSLYLHLIRARNAIARYGSGERMARVEEAGPLELQEIARAFNDVATALEQQRKHQLTFLASVAHDLRNPLSALGAAAGVIAPHRPLPPPDRVHHIGEVVSRQVKRMNTMVEDLLDATRIEAGRLELRLEVRDARELVRDAAGLYGKLSPSHEVVVSDVGDEPRFVHCDPVRLDQVLGNLLSNAIKYSPRGGPVEVRLSQSAREVVIAVRDEGIGIAPEHIAEIFEPFRRTRATRDAFPGVGLGLSVVRRIVEAHGGRIEVESKLGAGAEFRVHLPRAEGAA